MIPELGSEVEERNDPALLDLRPIEERLKRGLPLYSLVPKAIKANLEYRRKILRWGSRSQQNARTLFTACGRDLLFYINTFVWTYDNRKQRTPRLPFVTYPYQDVAFTALADAVGTHDILIDKSRDMGASWMCLTTFEWMWHFRPFLSFLLVSRTEALVDKTEDPKSLMWKIDFIHRALPGWLLPGIERTNLHILNTDNGSTIDGESTTGDVGRGDRRTAILLDEFASVEEGYKVLASTRDATRSRIFNSTPKGVGNAFYDQRKRGTPRLSLHWSLHPEKAAGMYVDEAGKQRSPWYDKQCERAAHPMEIAQELDIDYLGSDYMFFDTNVVDQCVKEHGRPPFMRGELLFEEKTFNPLEFQDSHRGRLKLWANFDAANEMPKDRNFVVSADIAAGTGASNSVIVVGDKKTREKVAEFVSPKIQPHELAQYAVALAKWFCGKDAEGAFLIWEANGPGRNFGNQVIDSGYRHIYYRTNDMRLSRKTTDYPGWVSTRDAKIALLGEYRRSLGQGQFINRSVEALQECRMYVYTPNGQILHAKASSSIDPSGAKDNHADRVIADALNVYAMEQSTEVEQPDEPVIIPGSFAWRRKQWEAKQKKHELW